MRTAVLVLSLLLTVLNQSEAQSYTYVPFPDFNAAWSAADCIYIREMGGGWVMVYNTYALTGDTLINNLHYGAVLDGTNRMGFLRTDSFKRTYYHWQANASDSTDHPIYDFSLSVGDTLFDTSQNVNYISIVDSIEPVLINNSYRNKFSVRQYQDRTLFLQYDTWIEGIGSLISPISYYVGCVSCSESGQVVYEFLQNDTVIYVDSVLHFNCGTQGVDDLSADAGFGVYPDPMHDCLIIENHDPGNPLSVAVLNGLGQKLCEQTIDNTVQLDVSNYPAGVYFIQATDARGMQGNRKIVKF